MNATNPDPDSLAYARYWEPVLAAPARRLLERTDVVPHDFLDVGAGTGSLTLAAAKRWPAAHIVGLDASVGMLSVAQYRAATDQPRYPPDRFDWIAADAARMPLGSSSFDLVTSSFMLQLVDDRPAVLGEVLRVLRPGGQFGLVTWIAEELTLGADDAFDEALAQLGLDEPGAGFRPSRSTDYEQVEEAGEELSEVGFDHVEIGADALQFSWSREAYIEFKTEYDEHELLGSLPETDRARLFAAVRERFATLGDDAFTIHGPLVWALGRRPTAG
jgi:ubiquinone/menaquinone biosynthesis C-methylase UbiE